MSATMPKAEPSLPVRSLDNVRPTPAKAGLHRTSESDSVGSSDPIGLVVRAAVIKHYGSVKAAAYELGQVDPSLMVRELEAGKLGRLDVAKDAANVKAAVADALNRAYGRLEDPKARAKRSLREARRAIEEAEQYMEFS